MPQFRMYMYDTLGRGVNPFEAPQAEMVTTDMDKFLQWVTDMEARGWLQAQDHEAHINMLRGMAARRRSELSKPYDPTPEQVALDRAHKPSGKGQKPYPKPTRERDKKVAGPWEPIRTKW